MVSKREANVLHKHDFGILETMWKNIIIWNTFSNFSKTLFHKPIGQHNEKFNRYCNNLQNWEVSGTSSTYFWQLEQLFKFEKLISFKLQNHLLYKKIVVNKLVNKQGMQKMWTQKGRWQRHCRNWCFQSRQLHMKILKLSGSCHAFNIAIIKSMKLCNSIEILQKKRFFVFFQLGLIIFCTKFSKIVLIHKKTQFLINYKHSKQSYTRS